MGYYSSYSTHISQRNSDPKILNRILSLKDKHNISPNVSSFLSSLVVSFKKYGGITAKQREAFQKIEQSYLNQAAGSSNWHEEYNSMKRERAEICALYYISNPPYYGDLAYRILNDDSFIPTEEQYISITENKYATKVLESFYSSPKFKTHDYVSLRKNHPYDFENDVNLYVIIQVAPEPITTAAKNTKKYKILPINDEKTEIVEERWLKLSKIK